MSNLLYSILLVEDDKEIIKNLTEFLNNEGFVVNSVTGQKDALLYVDEHMQDVDIVLLDVSLEDGNGFAVCTAIKQNTDIPVIFLTASGDEYSVVMGLDMGADDYITKPYNSQELVARVRSHLRRYTRLGDINSVNSVNIINNGRLRYHVDERSLFADDEPVKLTAIETKIIDLLMRNLGRVFPAEEIYRRVWDEEAYSCENTVMVHIRRIREKIELNSKEPEYLKVVWGIGYKIEKMEKNI